MEKLCGYDQQGDQMDMPPGFRFHPTDEELITHYLSNKAVDNNFVTKAIGEVDMNKTEPWELPRLAKLGGKELYFFCVRDKKYPTGLRTNRATAAGYWKATGKDKEIFKGRSQLLIGMKKTLVFYTGRAPKGEKTNWVIHEFRLEGKFPMSTLPKSAKSEWVICRVFYKTSGGKKLHISGPMRPDSGGAGPSLPPLMDSPTTYSCKIINSNIPELIRVPCFSNTIDTPTTQKNIINNFLNSPIFDFESNSNMLSELQSNPLMHHFSSGSSLQVRDQGILMGEMVTVSQDTTVVSSQKNTRKFEEQGTPSTSTGPIDLDCIWNY